MDAGVCGGMVRLIDRPRRFLGILARARRPAAATNLANRIRRRLWWQRTAHARRGVAWPPPPPRLSTPEGGRHCHHAGDDAPLFCTSVADRSPVGRVSSCTSPPRWCTGTNTHVRTHPQHRSQRTRTHTRAHAGCALLLTRRVAPPAATLKTTPRAAAPRTRPDFHPTRPHHCVRFGGTHRRLQAAASQQLLAPTARTAHRRAPPPLLSDGRRRHCGCVSAALRQRVRRRWRARMKMQYPGVHTLRSTTTHAEKRRARLVTRQARRAHPQPRHAPTTARVGCATTASPPPHARTHALCPHSRRSCGGERYATTNGRARTEK